jgi:hypothetical protein
LSARRVHVPADSASRHSQSTTTAPGGEKKYERRWEQAQNDPEVESDESAGNTHQRARNVAAGRCTEPRQPSPTTMPMMTTIRRFASAVLPMAMWPLY